MKKLAILSLLSVLVIACGSDKKSSSDDSIPVIEFASPHDPCLIDGVCSNAQSISLDQAYNLFIASLKAPVKGQQITHDIVKTDTHYTWDPNTDIMKKTMCDLAYTMTRTVVDFDLEHTYVKEDKVNVVVKPQSNECLELLEYNEYKPSLIVKEDREDMNPEPISDELRIAFKGVSLSVLLMNGETTIRTSGVITYEYTTTDSNGNQANGKGRNSFLTMNNLEVPTFLSNSFDHSITKDNEFDDEELFTSPVRDYDIDVSGIDVWSMDDWDIVDRSSSDDEDNNMKINNFLFK
jgi:hypothetical protein